MSALTETEIFDCLADNFKSAVRHCEQLARTPRTGAAYHALREELRLIEGAARQASAWREDSRWLQIGLYVAEAHKRAGNWLRGAKLPDGTKIKLSDKDRFTLFNMLADVLRKGQRRAEDFRTKATGRVGMILPEVLPGPHRDTKPMGWTAQVSKGGIILPDGMGLH